jgi:hypothetical protein
MLEFYTGHPVIKVMLGRGGLPPSRELNYATIP